MNIGGVQSGEETKSFLTQIPSCVAIALMLTNHSTFL